MPRGVRVMGTPIFDDVWASILSRRTAAQKAAYLGAAGMHGIDVSSWQRVVQWAPVAAAGYSYVYIKAAEGNSRSYPTLDAQYQGAVAAGLVTGLYVYAVPGRVGPEETADALALQVNRLRAVEGHLPPALDLEEGEGDLSGWARRFVNRLREQTGCRRVMIYSSASMMANQIREDWMDDDIVLWLANFGAAPGHPSYLTPRVAIHQYSQDGQVPGVDADVDLNFSLWPLSQIITGDDDMTPEQSEMLEDIHDMLPVIDWIYGQLAGPGPDGKPAPFPTVPGWVPFEGGTDKPLSMLDYLREANVQLNDLSKAIQDSVTAGVAGAPANVDTKALADELVAQFLTKLTALPPAAPSV